MFKELRVVVRFTCKLHLGNWKIESVVNADTSRQYKNALIIFTAGQEVTDFYLASSPPGDQFLLVSTIELLVSIYTVVRVASKQFNVLVVWSFLLSYILHPI